MPVVHAKVRGLARSFFLAKSKFACFAKTRVATDDFLDSTNGLLSRHELAKAYEELLVVMVFVSDFCRKAPPELVKAVC